MSHLSNQPATSAPALATHNLSVHYGNRPALEDISISVRAGEVVGLLGPNGAGKSTLLKVIAGMVPASHGACLFQGRPIRGAQPGITYVPQRSGAVWTFPISVLDAVLLGLARSTPRFRGFGASERQRALDALRHVEMERYAQVQIGALSGGQQQRVFLARALLACGTILLLDEPFTGVDVPTQELFVSLFDDLKAKGTSIIYATHDLEQARQTSDTVMLINRRLIASGPPREVFHSSKLQQAFGGAVIVVDGSSDHEPALIGSGQVTP
ncbi:MAG: metal ABC transporter ATP-binding protein [Chloroflexota bacterium]|nr:metal ABC transporter ATP-binding protein [Chloroflexota bacterium]